MPFARSARLPVCLRPSGLPGILLVLVSLFVVGCVSFRQTAGKTMATTAQTADAAMKGWAAYVNAGGATLSQESQVRAIYARYQASMGVATNAFAAYAANGDKSGWESANNALQASSASLLQLIQAFSTMPKP